jgi:chemotaxis protein methyltransferase CheR
VTRLDDADFAALRAYLLDAAGLVFDRSRRAGLAGVVAERLRATGAGDVPTYLAGLADDPTERQGLLDSVTVQETQFFRNAPQMQALRRRVLPELVRRTSGRDRPLTIWSAGCSTGEEPYTLAMLLLELGRGTGTTPAARILATDVSAAALRVAARGRYAGRTLDSVPATVGERWFEPLPGGGLAVTEPVRRMVELRLHNLVTDPAPFGPGEVDLVVCRNVTIYFDRVTTRALVHSFRHVLAEGGYLLLGHSETLWQVSDDFTLVPVGDAFVYRRTHDAVASAPARRRRPVLRRTPAAAPSAEVRRARPVVARRTGANVDPSEPVSSVDRSRAELPTGARELLAIARRHLAKGEYTAAARAAEAAVRADPLASMAYVVLGRARATMGEDPAAVDALRKAVYLTPAAGDAHFLLAGALSRLGQRGPASAAYRAAAATVQTVDPEALEELLGGRDPAEFADLCDQLARREAHTAPDQTPVASSGGQQ